MGGTTFFMRENGHHNRRADPGQPGCAHALQCAEADQPAHGGRTREPPADRRERAAEGSQAEEEHGEQEQALASILVGKAPHGEQEYCIHQVIGVEHPTDRGQICLQAGLDGGNGNVHDGRVEDDHAETTEDRRQDQPGSQGPVMRHRERRDRLGGALSCILCIVPPAASSLMLSFVGRSSSLFCRFDVLVYMKEVGRVVPVLDLHQPLIIVTVAGPDAGFPLVRQEVDIDPFLSERLDGSPEALNPLQMGLCLPFRPLRNHLQDGMIVA